MQRNRVTLREIAARAGVSVMTVSYALRDDHRISETVRARVRAMADTLGYVPDPAMAALAAYRQRSRAVKLHSVIAVVHVLESADRAAPARHASFAAGLIERARRLGYVVTTVTTPSDEPSLRKTAEDLEERGVRGVVLFRQDASVDDLPFCWARFACVRISGNPSITGIHNIALNNGQGMMLVLSELKRRGYRRPGLIHSPSVSHRSGYQWPSAFSLARLVLPEADPEPLALPEVRNNQEGGAAVNDWIRRRGLDCVIFAEESWLLDWFAGAGLCVPEDVGFCSLHADRSAVSGLVRSDLIGQGAIALLNSALQTNDLGLSPDSSTTVLVPCKWQDGNTLRSAPRR
ncbi:MAG TPA: LacI family DNA-binding transcriptional regulator [Tepidisphaeraceae bacterium]|nr:LacI family DNA-binding transcriptional regulator [Tepidisphaeraceae bacterium]